MDYDARAAGHPGNIRTEPQAPEIHTSSKRPRGPPEGTSAPKRQRVDPAHVVVDGKHTVNRKGKELCRKFNEGTCSQSRVGNQCPVNHNIVHQCNKCLANNHGGHACGLQPAAPSERRYSGSKGKGKGKSGRPN